MHHSIVTPRAFNIYCQIRVPVLFRLFKDISGHNSNSSRTPPTKKVLQNMTLDILRFKGT